MRLFWIAEVREWPSGRGSDRYLVAHLGSKYGGSVAQIRTTPNGEFGYKSYRCLRSGCGDNLAVWGDVNRLKAHARAHQVEAHSQVEEDVVR